VISGTRGAGAGAGSGSDAAFGLVVVAFAEELGEAKERGARGPSTIIEMIRHAIRVFEV
jgi:hypothetical protein